MKRRLLPLAIIPFTALAACSGDMGEPCTGEFSYSNGSMPPPHSYRWTVTFDEGGGNISWTSPHASPQPEWSAEFVSEPADVVALCDALREAPEYNGSVGGELADWNTSAGSGSTDTDVAALVVAALDVVGEQHYEELRQQYGDWKSEQE